jgi:hypothetical protein
VEGIRHTLSEISAPLSPYRGLRAEQIQYLGYVAAIAEDLDLDVRIQCARSSQRMPRHFALQTRSP